MESIKSFAELTKHLTNCGRTRVAVANAVDDHSLEAVVLAIKNGFAEAYLVGDKAVIEKYEFIHDPNAAPYIHIINIPDVQDATVEAVRMVRNNEADVLMKGLVNTDVIIRAILDKEKGLLPPGNVLSFTATFEVPGYHKLIFLADPAVIPSPTLEQRRAIINYAIATARKFGVEKPKVALIHATEKPNPKIQYMSDYVQIVEEAKEGKFGNVTIDGPMDIFLALDKERGAIKKVPTPVLGDADILIFPNFESANAFYKALIAFAGAEMGGKLEGTTKPVVLTSRSDSIQSKFNSLALACITAHE